MDESPPPFFTFDFPLWPKSKHIFKWRLVFLKYFYKTKWKHFHEETWKESLSHSKIQPYPYLKSILPIPIAYGNYSQWSQNQFCIQDDELFGDPRRLAKKVFVRLPWHKIILAQKSDQWREVGTNKNPIKRPVHS